jgi:hypothetical protein
MVLHLFRSLATKKEQTHHWGESALFRQNVNCTEVFILLLSIVQLSVYAIRTVWQEETVFKTKRRWLRYIIWSSYIGTPT